MQSAGGSSQPPDPHEMDSKIEYISIAVLWHAARMLIGTSLTVDMAARC